MKESRCLPKTEAFGRRASHIEVTEASSSCDASPLTAEAEGGRTVCFFFAKANGSNPCLSSSCLSKANRDVCSFVSEVQENKSLSSDLTIHHLKPMPRLPGLLRGAVTLKVGCNLCRFSSKLVGCRQSRFPTATLRGVSDDHPSYWCLTTVARSKSSPTLNERL